MGIGLCRNCGVNWREGWQFCRTCGITREQGMVTVSSPLEFQPTIDFSLRQQSPQEYRDQDDKSETLPASSFHDISPEKVLTEEEVVRRMYGLAYVEPRENHSEPVIEAPEYEEPVVAYIPRDSGAGEGDHFAAEEVKARLAEHQRNKQIRIAVFAVAVTLVLAVILILGITYLK